MQTRVQRWGNSLGLRIPKALASESGVEAGSEVDISFDGERLIVRPAARRYDLRDLVRSITRDNRHGEVATDEPLGHEAW